MMRPFGIGLEQRLQMPNSGSPILPSAISNLASLVRAEFNDASLIALLPMASMRVRRPIALSGATGLTDF